jgi:hypothetical protein
MQFAAVYERGAEFPSGKMPLKWVDVLGFELVLRHKKSVSTSFADVLRPSGATAECDWPSTVGRYRSHSPDRASAQMTRAAGGIREVPLSNSNRCRG